MNTPTIHVIYITVKSAPVSLTLAAVLLLAIPILPLPDRMACCRITR